MLPKFPLFSSIGLYVLFEPNVYFARRRVCWLRKSRTSKDHSNEFTIFWCLALPNGQTTFFISYVRKEPKSNLRHQCIGGFCPWMIVLSSRRLPSWTEICDAGFRITKRVDFLVRTLSSAKVYEKIECRKIRGPWWERWDSPSFYLRPRNMLVSVYETLRSLWATWLSWNHICTLITNKISSRSFLRGFIEDKVYGEKGIKHRVADGYLEIIEPISQEIDILS